MVPLTFTEERAQVAVEYLITYGWVILVIAIALGALYALGVFNTNFITPNTCIMTASFSCLSATLASNGGMYVRISQDTPDPINITAIACDSNQSLIHATTLTPQVYLAPGQNATFSITCWQNGVPFSAASGTLYSGYLLVSYTDFATGFNYTTVGTVALKVSAQTVPVTITALVSTSVSSTSVSSTTLLSTSISSSTSTTTTIVYTPVLTQQIAWNGTNAASSIDTVINNEIILVIAGGFPNFKPTATVDGLSATQIANQTCSGCGGTVVFFYYVAPAAGAHTVQISGESSGCCYYNFALAIENVSTSGIASSGTSSGSATTLTTSLSTSVLKELIVSDTSFVNTCFSSLTWSGNPTTPTKLGQIVGTPSTCVQGSDADEITSSIGTYSVTVSTPSSTYGSLLSVALQPV